MTKIQFATVTVFLVLIAAMLGVLVYSSMSPKVSAACKAVIDSAVSTTPMDTIMSDYQNSAYKKAENINQQIFMANEYQLMMLNVISEQQAELIKIAAACP